MNSTDKKIKKILEKNHKIHNNNNSNNQIHKNIYFKNITNIKKTTKCFVIKIGVINFHQINILEKQEKNTRKLSRPPRTLIS